MRSEKEDRRAIEKMSIVLGKHVLSWKNTVRLWLCKYFYQIVRQKWGTVYWILEEEKAFYNVAKNVAELTSIGWKVEFVSNKLEYLPEEFSKQCTDMKLDFVFVAYRNC